MKNLVSEWNVFFHIKISRNEQEFFYPKMSKNFSLIEHLKVNECEIGQQNRRGDRKYILDNYRGIFLNIDCEHDGQCVALKISCVSC